MGLCAGGKAVSIAQIEQVLEASEETFDQIVIESPVPVLVNFQTPWSKRMVPLLGQLAETWGRRLRVVQVNIATNPELATRFRIRAVPTLLIFKDGVPLEFIVGTVPPRFVFETVCKAIGVTPRGMRTRQAQGPRHWPSFQDLAFGVPCG
jgi:thioredoxin 1